MEPPGYFHFGAIDEENGVEDKYQPKDADFGTMYNPWWQWEQEDALKGNGAVLEGALLDA